MIRVKIAVILLCIASVGVKAQPSNIDSLTNLLNSSTLGLEERYNTYNELCYYYMNASPQVALLYTEAALVLAEKNKDKSWIAVFSSYMGQIRQKEGAYTEAFSYYETALSIAKKEQLKHHEAYIYLSMATLYHRQGKLNTALEYLIKALTFYENSVVEEHKTMKLLVLYNIGVMHVGMESFDQSLQYFDKAEELNKELNNLDINMFINNQLGNLFLMKKEYNKAIGYTSLSLEISQQLGNKMYESQNLRTLARIYEEGFKDYGKAKKAIDESLQIALQMDDPYMLIGVYNTLSSVYFSRKLYAESEATALIAWNIDSTNLNVSPNTAYRIALANIYLGDNSKAVHYLNVGIEMDKQLSNKNIQNLMVDMESRYEAEKKESRIAILEQEQAIYIKFIMAIAIAFLAVLGLLFYRHRLTIQKRKLVEQQIEQLEHDKKLAAIHAALNAEKAERDLIARDLHDTVGTLLTVVKNNMRLYQKSKQKDVDYFGKAFDVLEKSITELRRVVYHVKSFILTKEGLRAALDEFCRFIPEAELHLNGLNSRFDSNKEYVLFNCACELVNNALKHSGASKIDVHLSIDEDSVYLSVVDNGCGFNPQAATLGIGIDNIRTNLLVFGASLDIFSEPGKGTEINIEMPHQNR